MHRARAENSFIFSPFGFKFTDYRVLYYIFLLILKFKL
ncbi:hypothetical protein CAMSH0001_1176 [Campylobacter showae RM3277]|uniref:Uncharacterized protein n=1 Tax=Campylobacter showae RM3277 TaxID=553219 RepID=C6RDL9_9BACT|nr:hypothetical protein CAMSH0001_1176 [Campylobacter showae RM3277]